MNYHDVLGGQLFVVSLTDDIRNDISLAYGLSVHYMCLKYMVLCYFSLKLVRILLVRTCELF
jgi:hypothetical protein